MAPAIPANTHAHLAGLLEENREGLLTCVHCGLCLPACPTYRTLGNENDSPRGRIYLMRALVDRRQGPGEAFIKHIELCLGCRACETVCPSGVPYGQLLEASRVEVLAQQRKSGSITAWLTQFVLTKVFTRPRLLRMIMAGTRFVRDSGLAQLVFETGLGGARLRLAVAVLLASKPVFPTRRPEEPPAAAEGPGPPSPARTGRLRVALLRGCVMEGLFAETNRATERVLERSGCELVDAAGQVCCGALHAHAGAIDTARDLARRNIDAFAGSGCERIAVNAAGCGAARKEYEHLLANDPDCAARAREFSAKVRDISEIVSANGLPDAQHPVELRVAYDAACHLIHAQRVTQQPIELLESIPGLVRVPLKGYEHCCGGAGIYNMLHPELSAEILAEKLDNIIASGADTVATGNPGCIMQIRAGLLMRGCAIEVVHPIELLDAAL
ncbi:MAG TPA: heterodisulfide reductase-related iron-sulfur binding cluster [Blastocatellia bacterium]|nr:heterodisulfide reductase-related iron-sulfur binding cluster [Blastocatellia bacterium]